MKRTATTIRCVPRYGYESTNVRTIDLDLDADVDERGLLAALRTWFAQRHLPEAVFDVGVDEDGYFAVINDETFAEDWGTPLI